MAAILVVEDERIVAEDIQKSLEGLGYTISAVVSSGKEAIKRAQEDNPDLVLMDIVLKGKMDGIEAAKHIYSEYNIPVVYLTAYADEKKLQRAKVTEPYGYLLKPFEDKELHIAIEIALYKHEMEKKVRESEQWLSTTLKSIGDAVIATDIEGLITFMNPVAETLTGWTQKEAAGTPLGKVFHIINEETREHCENPFEKILKTGGIVGLANNTVLIAKDGTEKLIADSGAPICEEDHDILGTVLVFRDITEKRKMEENILRLKTEKMDSLTILAGGIAHDFNNILTAALCNIAIAKMQTTSEDETPRILAEAERTLLKAKNLTQQLLMFSREGAPVKKPASISELLKDAAEFALRGSSVMCKFCISDRLQPVKIDAGQIKQVINNLVINAEQAMPEGGVIKVSADTVTVGQEDGLPLEEGTYIRISVEDEGIGIPEQLLQKIFDPYFTTKQKGSGLGLATSYSIIKNHGGHIAVESELGVGTSFCIWLPASEKEVVTERNLNSLVRGNGKILLMDNDGDILKAIVEALKHLGYETKFAKDGKEAIELYRGAQKMGTPFTAVIIDLTIRGGMGGKETIEELVKINPDVKAIVASGYSTDPVMVNYKEYGFCDVVTKPYSIEELSTTLHEVIYR